MKQFESVLGKVLSLVILVTGVAFLIMWKQAEHLKTLQTTLTVADARNTTLLLFIPGVLMIFLGLINLVPERMRPKSGTPNSIMIEKLLSVVILLGGIALLILWSLQEKLVPLQTNLSVDEVRTPTLLLFIPGTLFIGLGLVNLLPDSLRGINRKPEQQQDAPPQEDQRPPSE